MSIFLSHTHYCEQKLTSTFVADSTAGAGASSLAACVFQQSHIRWNSLDSNHGQLPSHQSLSLLLSQIFKLIVGLRIKHLLMPAARCQARGMGRLVNGGT